MIDRKLVETCSVEIVRTNARMRKGRGIELLEGLASTRVSVSVAFSRDRDDYVSMVESTLGEQKAECSVLTVSLELQLTRVREEVA